MDPTAPPPSGPYSQGPYQQAVYVQQPVTGGGYPPPQNNYPPQNYPQMQNYGSTYPPPNNGAYYPQQPYGTVMQPMGPMNPNTPSSVVVVETFVPTTSFGRNPTACICPNCRANVVTAVTYSPGSVAWLSCLGLCCLGCAFFALIPFCVQSLQDVEHNCPNCGVVVKRISAMDDVNY